MDGQQTSKVSIQYEENTVLNLHFLHSIGSDCYDDERSDKRYKFRDPDIFLINRVSERLMYKMMEKKLLCDATLNIFSEHNTRLKSVKIKNCKVSKCGLEVLRQHKITDLEVANLRNVSIGDVLGKFFCSK